MPSDDDDDVPEQTAGNRRLLASEEDARRRKRERPRAVSVWKLCGINAFFLAYGAWISSFAIVTLPYESTRFFPDADAVALGGFMFIAGASQMSGPWAGYVSDRTRSAYGRRRPVLVKGAVVAAPSLVMLLMARTYYGSLGGWAPTLYYVAFTATMLALNVMYTAASGIVPDMIPDDQTGQSNGVLAAMSAAGACMGFVYTMVHPDVGSLYWFYLALLATCVPITCYCATEESSLGGVASSDDVESSAREGSTSATVDSAFSWRELASMYTISPFVPEQKSFFWLFVCRTLYYTGISAQVFLLYLLRDTAVKEDGSGLEGHEPQQTVARLSFIGQVGGMIAAYPAGLLSDVFGRKPLIVIACAGIISVYIMFMYIHRLTSIMYIGVYYGALNGMFLSVDYALAIDCLPSRENAARWLAVWGVASFIGTSIGPTVFALILHFSPQRADGRAYGSSQEGYDVMLVVGAVWMALCASFLCLVDSKKPRAREL
jgi:MFS family permease